MTLEEIDRELAHWRSWLERYEWYYVPDVGAATCVPASAEAYAAIRRLDLARARCVAEQPGR